MTNVQATVVQVMSVDERGSVQATIVQATVVPATVVPATVVQVPDAAVVGNGGNGNSSGGAATAKNTDVVADWGEHAGVMTQDGCFGFAPKAYSTVFVMLCISTAWYVAAAVSFENWYDGHEWLAEHEFLVLVSVGVLGFAYFVHLLGVVCAVNPIASCYVKVMMCPCINYLILIVIASCFGIITTRLSYAHKVLCAFAFVPPASAFLILVQWGILALNDDVQTILVPFFTFIFGMLMCIGIGIGTTFQDYEPLTGECYRWQRHPDFNEFLWRDMKTKCQRPDPDLSDIPYKIVLAIVECGLFSIGFAVGTSLNVIAVFRPATAKVACCSSDIDYTTSMHTLLALDMFYEMFNSAPAFALKSCALSGTRRRRRPWDDLRVNHGVNGVY